MRVDGQAAGNFKVEASAISKTYKRDASSVPPVPGTAVAE